MHRTLVYLLVAVWLGIGLGAKAVRYLPGREPAAAHADAVVASFLARDGWTPSGRVPLTRAGVYTAQLFTHADCARPMAVVVLGRADEASSLLRLRLGNDVAYIDAGRAFAAADLTAFLARTWRAGGGLYSGPVMPVIAVSPAPRQEATRCGPPPLERWREIGS